MNMIVAVDKNWGIGKGGNLLVRIPGDLKYFREMTLGNCVIMGRTTAESLPSQQPLKGRINVIMSRSADYAANCVVCNSVDEVVALVKGFDSGNVFVIGGQEIYDLFLPYCDTFYVTKIDAEFSADKHFENLDLRPDIVLVEEGEIREENGIQYRFTKYKRK